MTPEIIVSVDIETDGPIPGKYSMLSLGACTADNDFYVELQPISEEFIPTALAVSGLDRNSLVRNGCPPLDAMNQFRAWLKGLNGKPVFTSFSTWDWSFVYWYLIMYGNDSPFGHSSLDMKSYYMGKYGSTWRETAKGNIAKQRPCLLDPTLKHTHHALSDAVEQESFFNKMRIMND